MRDSAAPSMDLRATEMATGRSDTVLSGQRVGVSQDKAGFDPFYDVSRDGKDVLFTSWQAGEPQIWLAPMDHSSPPRRGSSGALPGCSLPGPARLARKRLRRAGA